LGEGLQVPGGVGEFEDAGGDEVDVGATVAVWGKDGELFEDKIA
jgi:hypothetical protein